MKKLLQFALVNCISISIIYLMICFVNYQFPVDFGAWDKASRAFILLFSIGILYMINHATYIILDDL